MKKLVLLFFVFTANWAKASMEAIAAEAEEDGSFDGDDSSTIAPYKPFSRETYYGDDISTVKTAKSPPQCLHNQNDQSNVARATPQGRNVDDCSVPDSMLSKRGIEASQGADVTPPSKHPASPLDDIVECDDEDNLSACGMETTMSPSGNFTIVENRDARFRQWVGARPSNMKKGKRRPPRAPKKGSS